jgi:hypothetical protein
MNVFSIAIHRHTFLLENLGEQEFSMFLYTQQRNNTVISAPMLGTHGYMQQQSNQKHYLSDNDCSQSRGTQGSH